MNTVDEILSHVAAGPLLAAFDYDGTLSHIVSHADDAVPLDGVVEALGALAESGETTVAIVSGRSLDDLRRMLGPPPRVVLIGEHGAAIDGVATERPEALNRVRRALEAVADRHPGAWVEVKETALCFHTREVAESEVDSAVADAERVLAELGAGSWHRGKRVVDVALRETSKGEAIDALRDSLGGASVFFVGDDTTDETVFAILGPRDVGVRVGDGETMARFRVAGPDRVADMLTALVEMRNS